MCQSESPLTRIESINHRTRTTVHRRSRLTVSHHAVPPRVTALHRCSVSIRDCVQASSCRGSCQHPSCSASGTTLRTERGVSPGEGHASRPSPTGRYRRKQPRRRTHRSVTPPSERAQSVAEAFGVARRPEGADLRDRTSWRDSGCPTVLVAALIANPSTAFDVSADQIPALVAELASEQSALSALQGALRHAKCDQWRVCALSRAARRYRIVRPSRRRERFLIVTTANR
jgi:hypothetical protein